jgi:hypothetical protein
MTNKIIHAGELALTRMSKVPLLDQLELLAAIRTLNIEKARDHFRKHNPDYVTLTSDEILSMLHAARILDHHSGAKPRADSEEYLRRTGQAVPRVKFFDGIS